MGVPKIHPLSETHLAGAAHLLEERHERHRAEEPLLPKGGDFRAQLERALSAEGAAGAVALFVGDVAAYLIGSPQDDGSSEVGLAGCAAREPELIRDLYNHLASGWAAGRHRVYGPATEAPVDADRTRIALGTRERLSRLAIDWRVVNLLADRFFIARGFRPTFVRLYRHVP